MIGTDRRLTVFVTCAVLGIAPLLVKTNLSLSLARVNRSQLGVLDYPWFSYLPMLAPLVALAIWHWQPARSWPWLLVAGTVFSIPAVLLAMGAELDLSGFTGDVLGVLGQCTPALILIGVLGAATWLHQRGAPAAAAAVMGTAVLAQFVGAAVLLTAGLHALEFSRTLTIVLFVLGAIGALGAVLAGRAAPMPVDRRPDPRATLAGGLAATSSILLLAWQPDEAGRDSYLAEIGVVFLAIGAVLGVLGGVRVLLGAAAAGLVIGPLGMLIGPSVEILDQFPVGSIVAVLVATGFAFGVAGSRFRLPVAVGGLAVSRPGCCCCSSCSTPTTRCAPRTPSTRCSRRSWW